MPPRVPLNSTTPFSSTEIVQQFLSSLIPLLVILPLLGGCLAYRKTSRSTTQLMLLLVAMTHLFITITLVISLTLLPIDEPNIRWSIPLNFTRWSSGLFDQVALRFDFVSGLILLLLPLILWTSCYRRTSSVEQSPAVSFFLLAGASLLVIANDVASLMGGAMFATLALISIRSSSAAKPSVPQSSEVSMPVIGWSFIFAGLAWLVACAAIVRAAPHGLPGMSLTNLSDLGQLLRKSALQHPAAQFTWEQYQQLPTVAVFIGVGVLGGLLPVHGLFARTIENGSLTRRLWTITIAKIAMLIFYRLLIEPDPASWARTAEFFSLPTILGFVYASYLMSSGTTSSMQFSRLVIWSQQFTLLGWVLLPESGLTILCLSSCVQLPGLTLLCLVLEFSKTDSEESLFAPKLIGIMSIGATSSVAGLFLIWNGSLQLMASTAFGAVGFILFAIACLISMSGLLNFLRRSCSETVVESIPLDFSSKSLLIYWSFVAILGNSLPLFLSSL